MCRTVRLSIAVLLSAFACDLAQLDSRRYFLAETALARAMVIGCGLSLQTPCESVKTALTWQKVGMQLTLSRQRPP